MISDGDEDNDLRDNGEQISVNIVHRGDPRPLLSNP